MFMVLSSWPIATVKVHPVHLMNVGQRRAAADPPTKPTDLGVESACIGCYMTTTTITIYYYSAQMFSSQLVPVPIYTAWWTPTIWTYRVSAESRRLAPTCDPQHQTRRRRRKRRRRRWTEAQVCEQLAQSCYVKRNSLRLLGCKSDALTTTPPPADMPTTRYKTQLILTEVTTVLHWTYLLAASWMWCEACSTRSDENWSSRIRTASEVPNGLSGSMTLLMNMLMMLSGFSWSGDGGPPISLSPSSRSNEVAKHGISTYCRICNHHNDNNNDNKEDSITRQVRRCQWFYLLTVKFIKCCN